jgi:U4/U6.U5 tri-snRNP-associated protein 2
MCFSSEISLLSNFPFKDIKSTVSPFLFLAVDLPPPPLFQDSIEKNIIPQASIHSVLAKYDGKTTQVSG